MPTPRQATRVVVEVVAVGGKAFVKAMPIPQGQTLGWAINASGLYAQRPELRGAAVGVWGKVLPPETLVAEGDRIEVYTAVTSATLAAHRARLRSKQQSRKVAP